MAKYTLTYACGHSGEAVLFGPTKERARKLAYWAKDDCKACQDAAILNQRAAETLAAQQAASAAGLPAIDDGTDKQCAWAERIRAEALAAENNDAAALAERATEMREHHAAGKELADIERLHDEAAAIIDAALAARHRLETETSARWWIDHRSDVNNFVRGAASAAFNGLRGH